jgi:hypothetical protein
MGLLNLTESERLEILNLHNNAKIIKEQVSAAPAAPTDDKSKIMAIQTALKTKYKSDLGTSGPNKDGIDGTLGPKTLAALSTVMKSKAASKAPAAAGTTPPASGATGTAAPAATTTAAPATGTAAPAATTTAAPATGTAAPAATTTAAPATQGADEFGAGAPQPQLSAQSQQALSGQLTPQQIRQQGRFDQRLARQARRNERRAGQQQ